MPPRGRDTKRQSRSQSVRGRASRRSRTRSRSPKRCPDCSAEGTDRCARREKWCHGYCQRHARTRGYIEPSRTSPARPRSPVRGEAKCSDCSAEGTDHPAQHAKWCRGYCQRHARARGYNEPSRTSPARPRSPLRREAKCADCNAEGMDHPARHAKWCHGYCARHARARGYHETSRTLPARGSPARGEALTHLAKRRLRTKQATQRKQRRQRCIEDGCPRAARHRCGHRALCKVHAVWHLRFLALRAFLAANDNVPPLARERLGIWFARQCSIMLRGGALPRSYQMLNATQAGLLRSLPCGLRSRGAVLQAKRDLLLSRSRLELYMATRARRNKCFKEKPIVLF
jgi:hypothetical protein